MQNMLVATRGRGLKLEVVEVGVEQQDGFVNIFGLPGSFRDQERSLFTCSDSAKRYIALASPEWYCSSMKRVWVNKAGSFKEALDFDTAYYLGLSSEERVEGVQFLREEYFKSKGIEFREDGKRLRRVFRIIKQA